MNTEAHLAAGWVLAHVWGAGEGRRYRGLVTFAAVAPDLDALSYVGGEHVYARMHHALGHNVFFGIIVSVVSVLLLRGRAWKVLLFTQLAFYSHYFGDYFFTRFPVEFWWPVSSRGYVYSYRIGLDHPVNLFLSYLSFVVMVGMAVAWKRTPVEVVSPELDARVVNLFRRKAGRCDVCGRGANERCGGCGKAVCMRHGRIGWGFRVRCDACAGKRRKGPGGPRRRVEEVEGRVS